MFSNWDRKKLITLAKWKPTFITYKESFGTSSIWSHKPKDKTIEDHIKKLPLQ
jgi:hypothetical protein